MIGPRPENVWEKYCKKTGELPDADKNRRERGSTPYPLYGLKNSAPNNAKIEYEKYRNMMFRGLARFYVPHMDNPYYTWEGKIVEKSTLKDRKLPLSIDINNI